MPPLRFLCLHGAGTNADIFESQLGPLIRELSKDQTAEFVFVDGEIASAPGPGVSGVFDGPYLTYFKWPRTADPEDDKTVEAAYELVYEMLESGDGPFDGLIGFSHGATLAFSFLVHHSRTRGAGALRDLGLRCAIFLNPIPPFREVEGKLAFDEDMSGHLDLPTLVVAGRKDFVYEHSLRLAKLCGPGSSKLLVHDKGHEVPWDMRNVRDIAGAVRDLSRMAMLY